MHENLRHAVLILRGMWAHRRLGLATAWGVGAAALAAIAVQPQQYEATARVFANTESILKPLMTGLTVQPNEEQRIGMLGRLLISRPNVERLVQAVRLDAQARNAQEREAVVDLTMKRIEIRAAGRDNLFTLAFRDIDPVRAKQAVDVLTSMFIESSKGGKVEDATLAKKFIDEQIVVYEKKLQDAENRLKEFRLRYFGLTPGEGKDFFVRMSEMNAQLGQARQELREAERARDAFKRGLASEEAAVESRSGASGSAGMMIAEVDTRIEAQKRSLDTLLQKYTDAHPDVQGARRVIRELEDQRRELVAASRREGTSVIQPATTGQRASETLKVSLAQAEASVASLSSRVAEYQERYNRFKDQAHLLPQLEAEYAQLNRDYDVNKKQYEGLVTRRESATISGEMQTVAGVADFRLVDPPRVSPTPVAPNRRLLVPIALVISLIAGLAAAYIANEARPTFYDGRALREGTGLPLLGVVSLVMNEARRRAERSAVYRYVALVGALVVVYIASLVAMEVMMPHVIA